MVYKHESLFINSNLLIVILFLSISFLTANAYAATLIISLVDVDQVVAPNFQAEVRTDTQPFNQDGQVQYPNLDPGSYSIDIQTVTDDVSVGFDVINGGTGDCDGNLDSAQDIDTCEIALNGDNNNNFGTGIGGSSSNFGVSGPSAAVIAATPQGEEIIKLDSNSDPPFRACEPRIIPKDTNDAIKNDDDNFVRFPSSAEYTIKGEISGDELESLIKDNGGSSVITIKIINDLMMLDQSTISHEVNSKFIGQLIYYKDNGLKTNVLNFRIDNIDTDCKYITLVEPMVPLANDGKKEFTPLGEKGKELFEKHSLPPELPKLLSSDALVREITTDTDVDPKGINSPFGPCVSTVQGTGFKANTVAAGTTGTPVGNTIQTFERAEFAEYNLVGNMQDKLDSKNRNGNQDLIIKITSDLNLKGADKAKIVNNENPYVQVHLLFNPNSDSAQKIDFNLKEASYNCIGVGFER